MKNNNRIKRIYAQSASSIAGNIGSTKHLARRVLWILVCIGGIMWVSSLASCTSMIESIKVGAVDGTSVITGSCPFTYVEKNIIVQENILLGDLTLGADITSPTSDVLYKLLSYASAQESNRAVVNITAESCVVDLEGKSTVTVTFRGDVIEFKKDTPVQAMLDLGMYPLHDPQGVIALHSYIASTFQSVL